MDIKDNVIEPRELKKLIKSAIESKPELWEEFFYDEDLYDDDEIDLCVGNVESIIDLGGEFYPLANAMIRYLLTQEDEGYPIDTNWLCGVAKYYSPNCLDDKDFAEKLLQDAKSKALDTSDYLDLSDYYREQMRDTEESHKHLRKAATAITNCEDAVSFLINELVDQNSCRAVLRDLESNLDNEDYFQDGEFYNPVDVFDVARSSGFISNKEFIAHIHNVAIRDNVALPYLYMARKLQELEETELAQLMLERAKANANSSEKKYKIFEFLKDDLNDGALAAAYMAENEAELTDPQNSAFQSAQKKDQVDQIIRCAVLAAVGDGQLAPEELSDIENGLRCFVSRWIEMQEAVEHYEQNGDLRDALKIFPVNTPVLHELGFDMALFGGLPPWLDELWEEIVATKDSEELTILGQREAAKITDPYLQKITSFACRYVAEADGEFSDGVRMMLYEMSKKWELDLIQADRWAKRYFIPVSTGEAPEEPGDEKDVAINEAAEVAADEIIRRMMDGETDAENLLETAIDEFIDKFPEMVVVDEEV